MGYKTLSPWAHRTTADSPSRICALDTRLWCTIVLEQPVSSMIFLALQPLTVPSRRISPGNPMQTRALVRQCLAIWPFLPQVKQWITSRFSIRLGACPPSVSHPLGTLGASRASGDHQTVPSDAHASEPTSSCLPVLQLL